MERTDAEWLEADGLGGFASGTVGGIRTRRYHALLLVATRPPAGRYVLVNGFDATVTTPAGARAITSQRYRPDVLHPDGITRLSAFREAPWPTWTYRLEDGTEIEQEIVAMRGSPVVVLSWKRSAGRGAATLEVHPFLSGRDFHALHLENPAFRFAADERPGRVVWRPYDGVPGIAARHNGTYHHQPEWYRGFLYTEDRDRGLDHSEDLASPGAFRFDLSRGEAALVLAPQGGAVDDEKADAGAVLRSLRASERRRRNRYPSRLHRSADDYVVPRGDGRTILAGYPWFAEWGRDTFIALRGLCLSTGRLDAARDILRQWNGAISEGMLPNRLTESAGEPEFNSVDASLWYVIAVHDYLRARKAAGRSVPVAERAALTRAVGAIVQACARGTRYGIRADTDGLLAAGVPGAQLSWMDARVGERVVTPRIGKPVEVQALWINALRIAPEIGASGGPDWTSAAAAFHGRFWNEAASCLFDVVDVDHRKGAVDGAVRPNQIFAIGGLPYPVLEGERARQVVDLVESRLWTPLGLRTLAANEEGYAPRYEGGEAQRALAYHQGTVWPWLLGPFVEAWVRVRGGAASVRSEARRRFLTPMTAHLQEAGLAHVSEIADGDPPHTPRGCPFQAWSVGELLRLTEEVLAPVMALTTTRRPPATRPRLAQRRRRVRR
jgi:predicted glycogen debranching enzyme